MKKIIYRIFITLSLVLFSLIIYLSAIGIKTKKFNSQIISQVKNIDSSIELKLNEVSVKLNLFSFAINAKTVGTDLIYKKKIIKLENIKSRISLKSVINNQFAVTGISISTKSIPIKDLISFIRQVNNEPKLLIAEHFIGDGFIVANLKLEFDKFGKVKKTYKLNGLVNDGQISLLNKKIKKLNFNFQITDKELRFNDINLLLNNKKVIVPQLTALRKDNKFLVSGNLKSKNLSFKKNEIENFINNEFLRINLKEIIFSSDNDFSFQIDQNLRFKNFKVKSVINLDHLKIDNFFNLKNNFPNIKDSIIFENQEIKLEYNKNDLKIIGSGNIFLQEESDIIHYEVIKNKKEFIFNTNFKISKNPFVINLLNYEKNEKSILNLTLKGKLNNDKLSFKEILILENKNILSIKNLKLSQNFKVKEIGNIKIDYMDKENLYNQAQIVKENKNYKIIGNSLNINKIVTELLESNNDKTDFFDKNFRLVFDLKKIYLDKVNSTNNLKGFLSLKENKITEVNLESEFSSKKK